jgi:actin related protein 2/3 complex, subunit 3
MPAYHSQINDWTPAQLEARGAWPVLAGGVLAIPVGAASKSADAEDFVDECLSIYRANCFFKNFSVAGVSDKCLVYAQLFVGECLGKVSSRAMP